MLILLFLLLPLYYLYYLSSCSYTYTTAITSTVLLYLRAAGFLRDFLSFLFSSFYTSYGRLSIALLPLSRYCLYYLEYLNCCNCRDCCVFFNSSNCCNYRLNPPRPRARVRCLDCCDCCDCCD